MPFLLRKNKDWCRNDSRVAVDKFHALARQYGRNAVWLTQPCALVTNNRNEPDNNFPYDEWREAALKTKPGIAPGDA